MRTLPQLSEQEYKDLMGVITLHYCIKKQGERVDNLVDKIKRNTVHFTYPYRRVTVPFCRPQLDQAGYNHLCDAIRNPLTIIQGSCYNLLNDQLLPEQAEHCNVITEQVIRIDDYIKSLKEG